MRETYLRDRNNRQFIEVSVDGIMRMQHVRTISKDVRDVDRTILLSIWRANVNAEGVEELIVYEYKTDKLQPEVWGLGNGCPGTAANARARFLPWRNVWTHAKVGQTH